MTVTGNTKSLDDLLPYVVEHLTEDALLIGRKAAQDAIRNGPENIRTGFEIIAGEPVSVFVQAVFFHAKPRWCCRMAASILELDEAGRYTIDELVSRFEAMDESETITPPKKVKWCEEGF